MAPFLDTIASTPPVVATLASALISASVAIVVLAASQYLARKSANMQFYAPKLQEVYLLLNDLAEHNSRLFKEFALALNGDAEARGRINALDEIDLYGHGRAKKMIMLVRLYFPRLARIHMALFTAERALNEVRFQAGTARPPDKQKLVEASGEVAKFVMLMEQEMVRNRDLLLGQQLLVRRYRETTQGEIKALRPPPDVPMFRADVEAPRPSA